MLRLLWSFVISCSLLVGCTAEPDEPLLALYKRNPWLMVIGSDSPVFSYYPDGTVIFLNAEGRYYTANIDGTPAEAMLQSLMAAMQPREKSVRMSMYSDQPRYEFVIRDGNAQKTAGIYGDFDQASLDAERQQRQVYFEERCINSDVGRNCTQLSQQLEEQPILPADLADLWTFAMSGNWVDAKPWTPDYIEVMFWPYEHAPGKSVVWPDRWPGLEHSTTRKRGGNAFSVYLPQSEAEAFKALLASKPERSAVLVEGHKMSVSYRLPFPHELTGIEAGAK